MPGPRPISTPEDRAVGFCSLLTIVFVTLKLIGKIDWSWWWVLSPSLIPLAIVLVVGVVVVVILGVLALLE